MLGCCHRHTRLAAEPLQERRGFHRSQHRRAHQFRLALQSDQPQRCDGAEQHLSGSLLLPVVQCLPVVWVICGGQSQPRFHNGCDVALPQS